MQVIPDENWIGVDVDDTLVKWKGTEYTPMQKNINSLIRHKKRGHRVVVWSQGGVEWALKVVRELGLEPYVDEVRAKPKWILDDKEPSLWTERYWYGDDKQVNGHDKESTSVCGGTDSISCSLYTTTTK